MNPSLQSPLIYFHVGLGKVASKYLQHLIFPHFIGLHYVPTTQYHRVNRYIKNHPHPVYLVSREFDQQLESEITKFAASYQQVHSIILLRRHSSWIASQYRRFAKNGFYHPFEYFFDLQLDRGRFKQADLNFYHKIELLEHTFGRPPLVLFHEDLIVNPVQFVQRIARFCKAEILPDKIKTAPKHRSYSEKQIKIIQIASQVIPFGKLTYSRNKILRFFQRLPEYILRYTILYLALLVPKGWLNKKPLIAPETLKQIDQLTEEDWFKCKQYALNHNKV